MNNSVGDQFSDLTTAKPSLLVPVSSVANESSTSALEQVTNGDLGQTIDVKVDGGEETSRNQTFYPGVTKDDLNSTLKKIASEVEAVNGTLEIPVGNHTRGSLGATGVSKTVGDCPPRSSASSFLGVTEADLAGLALIGGFFAGVSFLAMM